MLSVEAPTPLDGVALAEVHRAAALLGARVDALGGLDPASPAQQLARTLAGLAALDDPEDIVRETIAAARSLAGFESALLALVDDRGDLYAHHAEGSFAVALNELDGEELGRIASWVDDGTSCYTVADAAGRGFSGHEPLRRAGAGVARRPAAGRRGRRLGILVLADRAVHPLATEAVELLELLAVQAAGGLRMAAAVLELRERAARDPLTGLGHHATFHAVLRSVREGLAPGRQCALLIADIDGFKAINDTRGHAAGDDVLRATAGLLRAGAPRAAARSGSAATSSRCSSSARAPTRPAPSAGRCARARGPARHDAVDRRRGGSAGRAGGRLRRPRGRRALRRQAPGAQRRRRRCVIRGAFG